MSDISIRAIIQSVARASGIPVERLTSRRRVSEIVMARHLAMHIAREQGYSYPRIGRYFVCDHTTVMSGVKRIDAKLPSDAGLRETRANVIADLAGGVAVEIHVCEGCTKRQALIDEIRALLVEARRAA